jgi:hypothetical protein
VGFTHPSTSSSSHSPIRKSVTCSPARPNTECEPVHSGVGFRSFTRTLRSPVLGGRTRTVAQIDPDDEGFDVSARHGADTRGSSMTQGMLPFQRSTASWVEDGDVEYSRNIPVRSHMPDVIAIGGR